MDKKATEIAKKHFYQDRCMYCKMMFDLFCAKAKKNVEFEEFHNEPYKPDWCPGREPTYEYHS